MAQPSLDNRLNAAPRPWIRNSQTPPKSELRYSKPSSGNSQTLPKSELRYRKNSLVCSSLTPPPQARQRGRRIPFPSVRHCLVSGPNQGFLKSCENTPYTLSFCSIFCDFLYGSISKITPLFQTSAGRFIIILIIIIHQQVDS